MALSEGICLLARFEESRRRFQFEGLKLESPPDGQGFRRQAKEVATKNSETSHWEVER